MNWSPYQNRIFEWVDDVEANKSFAAGACQAVAGSGKSVTLLEAMRRMTGRSIFVAFNVSIVDHLRKKAPRHVYIRTMNSLGYSTLRKACPDITVCEPRDAKIEEHVNRVMGEESEDRTARTGAKHLANLAKLTLADPQNAKALNELIDRFDIDCGGKEEWVIECLPEILDNCLSDTHFCDFTDQLWMPIRLNIRPEPFDWIGVDECQDLSNVQRALLLRSRRGRFMAVGDTHQAIYGFAGADCESFDKIVTDTQATILPLSICYRCPVSHILMAKEFVPEIEAAPSAIEGQIQRLHQDLLPRQVQDGDMVICRCNAPLVESCLDLIRLGRKATIKGRDIGTNLLSLVRRIRGHAGSVSTFIVKLTDYRAKELRKLLDEKKNSKAASLHDRVETIFALADGAQTVSDLEARISEIFSDTTQGVIFSSIHRAKGLEAENVYLLRPDLVPHPCASADWEIQQEQNLQYVAYTRAKKTLGLVMNPEAEERRSRRDELEAFAAKKKED